MRHCIIIIATLFILLSCRRHSEEHLIGGKNIPSVESTKVNLKCCGNLCYLPKNTIFSDGFTTDKTDSNKIAYYSNILCDMKEPVLFANIDDKEIYRFLWLRSFYSPLCLRVEKDCNTYYLYCKLLNNIEHNDTCIVDQKKTIDQLTWNNFIKLFNECSFWNKKPMVRSIPMLDGATWLIEGRDKNYYNVYGTNMPTAQIESCAKFLIDISKIDSSLLYAHYVPSKFKEYSGIGKVYQFADEMPKFGKNDSSLQYYIKKHLSYPVYSKKNHIQGTVLVRIIIYEDGTINNIEILRGISSELDSVCVKLLRGMPIWTPGKLDGKIVKVELHVPFKFTLD